jgi:phosphoribosyl 1,2-cyclic phosphodiesterase
MGMGGTFQVEDDEFRCTASIQINLSNVDIMPAIVETVLISCGYSSRSCGFRVSNAQLYGA